MPEAGPLRLLLIGASGVFGSRLAERLALRLKYAFYPLLGVVALGWLAWDWTHARGLDAAENAIFDTIVNWRPVEPKLSGKTVVVEIERRFPHPLYGKMVTRTKRLKAHDEENAAKTGDRVRIYPADRWGGRLCDFVERDAKGRFANEYRERPPYSTRITHVAADAPGIKGGWVLLSLAPVI